MKEALMSDPISTTNDKPQTTNFEPSMPQNAPECPTFFCDSEADIPSASLSPLQLSVLDLMLAGQSDCSIARELHVDRKTLYRWKTHDPAFIHELSRRRDALFGQSTDRLRSLLDSAMDTLEKQVKDKWNPTSHRAASTILRLSRIGYHLCPRSPIINHQSSTHSQ